MVSMSLDAKKKTDMKNQSMSAHNLIDLMNGDEEEVKFDEDEN